MPFWRRLQDAVFMTFEYFSGQISIDDPLQDFNRDFKSPEIKNLNCVSLLAAQVNTDAFELAPHRIIWSYWQELRQNDDIASYSNIDPIAFNKAIGYVLLLEPNRDNSDFKYRVYGSAVANRLGLEMNGKWVSEFKSDRKYLSLAQYPKTIELRRPLYSEHFTDDGPFSKTHWCRLILPMQNSKGEIDRILVGNVPIDKPKIEP